MKELIELLRRSLSNANAWSGTSPGAEPMDARDIHRATAALLFEVSRADFHIHDDELSAIRDRLATGFDLDPDELDQLVELARQESDDLLSLHPFVRVINARATPEDKRRIMLDLWHVAYADGHLNPRQEATVRQIADLLYVPHAVYLRTKIEVEPTGGARRS
ncbi:TerB family tellurite resistance protein [Thioalkalivibrio sp.]|uniref:tellurite resistance TerB family protein n=1 Tax=Thioalkalivibrio sp. TaxID=2093813 RepID=UPI0039761CA3